MGGDGGGITPEEKIPPPSGLKNCNSPPIWISYSPPTKCVLPPLNPKIFGALRAQIYSSDSHSYNIKYRVIFQMRVSNGINFTIKIDLFYCLKLLSKYIKSHETFTYYSPLSRECSRAIPPPSPKIPPPDSPPSGGGAFPPHPEVPGESPEMYIK